MAYFTAVLTRDDNGWRGVDVDVAAGSPDELADVMRAAVDEDLPVLALLEREDEWFAVVRADGAVEVRVFVSDAVAAADSKYAELFTELPPPAAGSAAKRAEAMASGIDSDGIDADEDGVDVEDEEPVVVPSVSPAVVEDVWAGDVDLLDDLGVPAEVVIQLAVSGADPSAATVELGELLGCVEVLESLR